MNNRRKFQALEKAKVKVGILSLGCPRNLVDSENILGRLDLKGYEIVNINQADIAIINTCSFIEDAKKESIDAILDLIELKKEGKIKKILVYGCLAQIYNQELRKELPEVDAFIGKVSLNHSLKRFAITPKYYAYLKVCEGCVNNCSFCVIPKIKGKFNSLDIDTVLEKTEAFDRDKISELNIIGQDITGYGVDLYGSRILPELLKKIIAKTKNIGWIRLLYLYPNSIVDELLEVIKDEPRVCKYIDLPVQHINSRILKLMRRKTSKKDILTMLDKIRRKVPGLAIRTSVIVGFPSETEKEFKELLDFIGSVRFERLGAFIYSREKWTEAYNFKGQVSLQVKDERFNRIMSEQQSISREINNNFLNKVIEVLVEKKEKDFYLGRSQYDAPEVDGIVYIKSGKTLKPGDFVKVKIIDTLEYDLVGELS